MPVTLAYVRSCGGNQHDWEVRWREVAGELAVAGADSDDDTAAPYRGLETFETGDAEWFFGRRRLVDQLLDRLSTESFLAVFGPSGSGKSSVLRAGLLATLERSGIPGAGDGPTLLITPGEHPVEAVAAALAKLTRGSARSLRDDLVADPRSIRMAIHQALPPATKTKCVVFIVDQFEEVFTLCRDAAERDCFIACLLAAAQLGGHGKVVLGVRAGFYARCAENPALAAALRDRQIPVGAMDDDELRDVVTGPAAHAGLKVERALTEVIVADARGEPGALPLVSHALLETWRRRRADTLTLAGYRHMGGIEGGIAQTAERVFEGFDPEQRRIAQQVFLRLTALGEGAEDTHRRVHTEELLSGPDSAAMATVLDSLAAARLLTVGPNEVRVAHEAIIRHWPRLRTWLSEDRDLLRAHRRLTEAAVEWDRLGRDDGLLYRGVLLAAWDAHGMERLNALERAFLAAGRQRQAHAQAARRRRLHLAVSGLLSAVLAMSVLAATALAQAARATDERDLAVTRQLTASARSRLPLDPVAAVRLARRAYEITPTEQAEDTLRQAILEAGLSRSLGRPGVAVRTVAFSPDGRWLALQGDTLMLHELTADGRAGRRRDLARSNRLGPALAFHPRGRYLASTDRFGTISVWDLFDPGGSAALPLRGSPTEVESVAFSPEGRWLAGAGGDGTVRVWDWAARDARPSVVGTHSDRALGVAFSPDGRRIASGGADGAIRLWSRTATSRPITLRGHEGSVESVAFSPDGRLIASGGDDGTVRIWDTRGRAGPRVLNGHIGAVRSVAFSPDGRRIASGGDDGVIRIWNTSEAAAGTASPLVVSGRHGNVWSVAFAPGGRTLASGSDNGTTLWDVTGGGGPVVLRGHEGPVWDATASPDGRKIASAGEDGTVRVWNSDGTGDPIVFHGPAGRMFGVAFSPDGTRVAGASEDGTIRIWKAGGTGDPVTLRGAPSGVQSVTFTPDGHHVVSANHIGRYIWDADKNESTLGFLDEKRPITSARNRGAPFAGHITRTYQINADAWRSNGVLPPARSTKEPLAALSGGLDFDYANSVDGRLLATRDPQARTVQLWNPEKPTAPPLLLQGHQGPVRSVAFSPNGHLVATTADDNTIRIWKSTGKGEPIVFRDHGTAAENINFTPDGRLISTYGDGQIRIWRCDVCGPMRDVLGLADQYAVRSG